MALCLSAPLAWSDNVPLEVSIEPRLLTPHLVAAADKPGRARLESGLDLSLDNPLLALDMDYSMQSLLRDAQARDAATTDGLSQQLKARLHSSAINRFLGVDAGITADSLVRDSGDIYRHRVSPGLTRSIAELARLRLNFDYQLDKPAPQKLEKQKRGYSMALDGSLGGGRLLWSGSYSSASTFEDSAVPERAVEALNLKSRYLVNPSLQVELSSAIKHETRGGATEVSTLRRYGAAFDWKPTREYSLGFRLNSLENGEGSRRETTGSGRVSWLPRPDLQFTLDYGDQVVSGDAGWMLHTRFDLNG